MRGPPPVKEAHEIHYFSFIIGIYGSDFVSRVNDEDVGLQFLQDLLELGRVVGAFPEVHPVRHHDVVDVVRLPESGFGREALDIGKALLRVDHQHLRPASLNLPDALLSEEPFPGHYGAEHPHQERGLTLAGPGADQGPQTLDDVRPKQLLVSGRGGFRNLFERGHMESVFELPGLVIHRVFLTLLE